MQILLSGNVPKLDACTRLDVNQFGEVQPVRLRVVVLSCIDNTPVIILVNVGIQRDLLLCINQSDSEID